MFTALLILLTYRVQNTGDDCIWCCAEMAAVHQGYPQVMGAKPPGRYVGNVTKALKGHGVPCEIRAWVKDHEFLASRLRRGPVVVLLKSEHAVLVLKEVAGGYRYVDPNRSQQTFWMSAETFDREWTGGALFVRKRGQK